MTTFKKGLANGPTSSGSGGSNDVCGSNVELVVVVVVAVVVVIVIVEALSFAPSAGAWHTALKVC
jgi:hypothetical protein